MLLKGLIASGVLALQGVGAVAFSPREALVARDCSHNNCLRAVIASGIATRKGTADCSSYLLKTVTPPTYTATVTSTVGTVTVTVTGSTTITTPTTVTSTSILVSTIISVTTSTTYKALQLRTATISQPSIPAYASPCPNAAAYSSACSCVGVTAVATTAAIPTYIYTLSVTATQTVFVTNTFIQVATSTQTKIDTTTTTTSTIAVATSPHLGTDDCTGAKFFTSAYGESYTEFCGSNCVPTGTSLFDLVVNPSASFTACITTCSQQNSIPNLAIYNINTATCVCWTSYGQPSCTADPAYDSAYFFPYE